MSLNMDSSSESVILLLQQNEELMEQQQAFREIIKQLTKENTTLREQNTALTVQNSTYLELFQQNQDKDSPQSEGDDKSTGVVVEEMQRTIEALQERVIGLIQEKLSMQMFIEELEHDLAMVSTHTMPMSKFGYEKISPDHTLDDIGSQDECLETARRQQLEQLLLDNVNVAGRPQLIDENPSNALLREFDIRKELEEQLHKRTTVVRPVDGFVRSTSCPTSSLNHQGVVTSRFVRGGKNETLSKSIQEAKEGNEKQRSRLWIGRIGFKGTPEAPPTVGKPTHRGLGNRRNGSDTTMMIECDDEVIERFNDRRESAAPYVIGNLSKDESGANITESITNMNLVL